MVNTVYRIALYGARNIRAGEELFFDYGPMFPDEQLGGKERKAAPHVRNSNLVREFHDVVESEDEHGNRRARKAITSKKGKNVPIKQRLGQNTPNHIPRKSRADRSEAGSGPSNGTSRSHNQEKFDAEERLYSYNIAEEDRLDVDPDAVDGDDDFEPMSSSDRSRDGGSESEDEEEDDDEDGVVNRRRRRGRPLKHHY
jgi:hypothetical protein